METTTAQKQGQPRNGGNPVEAQVLLRFVRQLSVKLKAGLSPTKALAALSGETRHRGMRQACAAMHASVAVGGTLALAMRAQGAAFDPVVIGLVDWGEKSRKLRIALSSIADYLEHRDELRRGLRRALSAPLDALWYVMLATFVAAVALSFLVREVLPAVAPGGGGAISVLDRVASYVADGLRVAWPWVGLLGFLGFVASRLAPRFDGMRAWLDALAVKLPLVGDAVRTSGVALFLRTAGIWMEVGGTLVQAMAGAAITAPNTFVRDLIFAARKKIEEGKPHIETLLEAGFLRLGDVATVQAADRRGQLGQVLLTLAQDREQEAIADFKRLGAATHTLVVALLGLAILAVVLTLYVPVFVTH